MGNQACSALFGRGLCLRCHQLDFWCAIANGSESLRIVDEWSRRPQFHPDIVYLDVGRLPGEFIRFRGDIRCRLDDMRLRLDPIFTVDGSDDGTRLLRSVLFHDVVVELVVGSLHLLRQCDSYRTRRPGSGGGGRSSRLSCCRGWFDLLAATATR